MNSSFLYFRIGLIAQPRMLPLGAHTQTAQDPDVPAAPAPLYVLYSGGVSVGWVNVVNVYIMLFIQRCHICIFLFCIFHVLIFLMCFDI